MTRHGRRRWRRWVVAFLVAVVAAATVSWTSASTLLITGPDGAPVADVFVRYHYSGYVINPVHPITYVARRSVIIRADSSGRAAIPFAVHGRRPLPLSTPPSLSVDCVYVPNLHNAVGPISRFTSSVQGVFTIDEQPRHIVVFDLAQDPERWRISLWKLFDCIRNTLSPIGALAPADPHDTRTAAHARELIGHLRRDYARFMSRYGDVPRPPPVVHEWHTEREKQQMAANWAREPLWGPVIEDEWRYRLAELDRLEAALK